MKKSIIVVSTITAWCVLAPMAQGAAPGAPEENGLTPKTTTVYVNPGWESDYPDNVNNTKTESLGVAIASNGNVLVGWEDDGSGLLDLEAVWTLYDASANSITPPTTITSQDPSLAGQSVETRFLAYFRADGSPVAGWTSWGPKIKANPFGEGLGMGATSFALGAEVAELASLQLEEGGGAGDFPSVQLLDNAAQPIGIVAGATDAYAETPGDIRIGDWDYLSNGNIVIVGESRQKPDLVNIYGGAAEGNHAIFRIVDARGAEVKAVSLVSETPDANEIWHGVGVTQDGFAVRFNQGGAKVRMFDNAGNPTTGNLDLATLTGHAEAGGGGRGDGAGFHGNGKDAYVAANASGSAVWVTVLNTDGTVRYSRTVADDIDVTGVEGRVDAAIDPAGRVIVVFGAKTPEAPSYHVAMGRLFTAEGEPEGGTFYVSEDPYETTLASGDSARPRVAWRSGLAAVVWESRNSEANPGVKVVAMRLFSTFKPGSIESVGLTRIVPDTPIDVPAQDNLGNWEPYISVLGNSTFLLEANTFAEGSATDMRYVVALQPVAGGAMKLGEGFYADDGTPYTGSINASRQNGNPGRVAGDKRPGAVNFMVGGEASPHAYPEFGSDNRWNLGFWRDATDRYGTVQIFSLDPATLEQTPLTKAVDAINGRLTSGGGVVTGEVGRFGGGLAALDNGNFLAVVDDKSQAYTPSRATTAVIMAPDGSIVKESFVVEERDLWDNVAAFRGGFCIRVHENLHFFDNAGNLLKTVNQNTSGESYDTGRGDGTRIAAHINTPYVFLAGRVGANTVRLSVWDARDQTFVAKGDVSEPGFTGEADRVNLAVDALNRVTVSWVVQPAGYEQQQVAARVLAFDEAAKSITPLTSSFLPFINTAQTGGIRSRQMSVAMTTRQICIAAKGEINLENKPANGANSPRELNFYTVISHPDPQNDPTPPIGGRPELGIARDGNNITVSWTASGVVLQSATAVTGPWSNVETTGNSYTKAATEAAMFFRLRSQ